MYTGASYRDVYIGEASEFKLRSIPYFFKVIASYYSESKDMIAVFEDSGRIPGLAREGGYKAGRSRNPHVEWEMAALKNLLEYIGFPIMHVKGQEADYVINNYCREHGGKEEIYILSADRDLSANVRGGRYSTSMLSFSSVSYNINRANFESITGVEYNFMNLNKLLLGCKSDNIKPFPNGKDIYDTYLNSVKATWRRAYKFDPATQVSTDLHDNIINHFNTYQAFMAWLDNSKYGTEENKRELDRRNQLVQGPIISLPKVPKVDWEAYNRLIASLNMKGTSSIKQVKEAFMNQQTLNDIYGILRRAQNQSKTMYEGASEELEELTEVGNLDSILGILDGGGQL